MGNGGYNTSTHAARAAAKRAAGVDTFDHDQRMKVLQQAMSLINEEAPAFFLWRHQWAWGLSQTIDFQPEVTGDIWGWKIKVRPDRSKTRG